MKKYEKDILQSQLNSEKRALEELKRVYEKASQDCADKIAALSARTDMENLQSIIYQKQYQQALKKQIDGILDVLHGDEFETISAYLQACYDDGFISTMYSLTQQGIPLIVPIDQSAVVRAIQTDSKISKGLYERLGEDVGNLKTNIRAEISRGISNGSTYNEIAAKIAMGMNSPFNKAINNAIRITRTEGNRISNKSAMDAMYLAKEKGADQVKQWCAALDSRTRSSHRRLDGQIRDIGEEFSNGLQYPLDSKGKASEVVNCRCTILKRARWALGEEELNTLKERAAYYGLDKSDEFEEYKKKYLKAVESDRVRSNLQMIKGKVVELSEYTVDGITYKVDGKHVLLDNTAHEKEIAILISKELDEEVSLIPRVVYPQGISTPDYIINDKKYDLKEPTGNGKNVLYNMVHKKKNQADNFVFDITNCPLDYDAITEQVEGIFTSSHTAFVDSIIIIKDGKVKEQFHRNKKRNQ